MSFSEECSGNTLVGDLHLHGCKATVRHPRLFCGQMRLLSFVRFPVGLFAAYCCLYCGLLISSLVIHTLAAYLSPGNRGFNIVQFFIFLLWTGAFGVLSKNILPQGARLARLTGRGTLDLELVGLSSMLGVEIT